MSETRLGITLAGRNELTPVIDAAKAQLRGLEQELENITNKTGRWAKMTQADLVAMTGVIKANIAQVRAELRGLETQLAAASSVSQVSLGSLHGYESQIQELKKLETGLVAATTAQERLADAQRSAARAIAEGAAARNIPALQYGYQVTGQRELVESSRDERGRFTSGQGSGPLAAAIVGAEADLDKAQAMVRIRQESAEAIALEKRALSEKATGLAEELRLSQEGAELKAAINQKLMNDAAVVHATEARFRAERQAGLEEEKRLGVEAAQLKSELYRRVADDAAKTTAAEITAQSKTALSAAAVRQMPIVERVRLWGADEATKEAAGLDFYANASARVRTAIENTANSTTRVRNAIGDFHRELSHAGGNIDQTTYAVRKLITVLDETARGQSGQRISTIGSAIRDLGVGRALPIIAPIGLGLAAIEVTHLVSEYSKLATKTDDAARAAGVGVEEYSRLARVLQLAGISAERLPTAMGQLSQSIRTAITEPLSAKGTAFAEIFGKDFFTDLPKFEEEPLKTENIDKLRQKYQELSRTVGEFQAMGAFRAALGRTEWVELAPLITAAETEYQKWNKAVAESHLPFTSGEVEKLREVDFATKKLVEDWEYLGKAAALFAGNTGLITFIDSVVLKLGALARNSREAAIAFESIGAGIVVGGLAGIPGGPVGMALGATAGAIAGGVGGAKIAEATRSRAEPGSVIVPVPPRTPITTRSEASTREEASQRANIPTTTSDDERARYPQLYGFGGAKIAPESLVSEAVKYREEIEQTHRVIGARLEAEKSEALGRARSETDRQRIEEEFSRKEAANRAKAVQEERDMLALYRQRLQDVPAATRPLAERDLDRRVGVQVEVEEFNTRKKLAQEEERFRREGFRVYDEEKRLELQLAKGNAAQEEQIFQERLQAAKQAFGEESLEFKRLQLEHVQAAQAATGQMLQDRLRIQDTIGRVSAAETRITAAGIEAQEIGQTIGKRVDHTETYRAEQVLIQQTAASQVEAYQSIAAAAGENAEIKIQALDRAALAAENAASQEVQLAHKISEEMHKAAEESSKVFVQFFDKAGGGFEAFIDDAVFRTKTWQQATRDLLLGIDKDLLHTAEKLGSQFAAQGLAKAFGVELAPGKGIGDLLGQMAGRALGLAPNAEDKQALMQNLLQTANEQRTTATGILSQIRDAALAQAQKVGTIQAGAGIPRTAETLPGVKVPGIDRYTTYKDIPGASPQESQILAQIRQRESSEFGSQAYQKMHWATPGQKDPQTLEDVEQTRVTRGSHAFGAYGFQPGTYREMGAITGRTDLSPESQDINALQLLRLRGPNSPGSWQASMPPGGYPTGGIQTTQGVQQLDQNATKTASSLEKLGQTADKIGPSIFGSSGELNKGERDTPAWAFAKAHNVSAEEEAKTFGLPAPYALGGPVHGFQHGGMGTDTIPAMLSPGEFVVKNSAVGHYGVDFLHSINSMALPRGFAEGGSVAHFSLGGINTPPPLQNTPQPYRGTSSPMTTPVTSGGITTESRGFLSPTLYTVYPKPNLSSLLAILGIGAVGLAGIAGLSKLFGDDEKKKADQLLKAKATPGGDATQIETPLSADSSELSRWSTSQISGLWSGGVAHFQEGGETEYNPTQVQEASLPLRLLWSAGSKVLEARPLNVGERMSPEFAEYLRTHQIPAPGEVSEPQFETVVKEIKPLDPSVLKVDLRDPTSMGELTPYRPREPLREFRLPEINPLETLPELKISDRFKIDFPPMELEPLTRTELQTSTQVRDQTATAASTATFTGTQTTAQIQTGVNVSPKLDAYAESYFAAHPELVELRDTLRNAAKEQSTWQLVGHAGFHNVFRTPKGEIVQTPIVNVDDLQGSRQVFVTGEQLTSMLHDFSNKPPTSRAEVSTYEASRPDLFGTKFTGSTDMAPGIGNLSTPSTYGTPVRVMVGGTTTSGQWWVDYGKGWEPTGITPRSSIPGETDFDKYRLDAARAALEPSSSDIAHLSGGQVIRPQDLLHNQALRQAYAEWENIPSNRLRAMTTGDNPIFDESASRRILEQQQQIVNLPRPADIPTFEPNIQPQFSDYEFSGMAAGNIGTEGLPGFQEGGLAEREFQLAGDVIPFSGRSRAPALPDPMDALKLRLEAAKSQGDWATVRDLQGEMINLENFRLPKFHTGGVASDEILARLQMGERVLSREQVNAVPKFHSGGYVWPGFQEGGVAQDSGMVGGGGSYAPTRSGSSSSDARAVYSSIGSLSSSMTVLSSDVEKVASGFKSLERATGPATQTSSRLSSELSAVGSALGTFKSILGSFSSMGGGGGGGGLGGAAGGVGGIFSLFGTIGGLFGLQKGGLREVAGSGGTDSQLVQFMATPGEMVSVMTPEQHRSSMVGGLPHFATGGRLTVGESAALSPAISQFVQGAATQTTGGPGTSGGVNVTIGSINGVMNAHDVRRMLVNEFSSISRAFQRGARNNFDLPGR